MRFIECKNSSEDYGDLAKALVTRADELGIHPREILALPTGFSVPDRIADEFALPKVPPAWWNEPLAPVDVIFESDGRVTLTQEAQEALEATAAVPTEPAEASELPQDQSPRPAPPVRARRAQGKV